MVQIADRKRLRKEKSLPSTFHVVHQDNKILALTPETPHVNNRDRRTSARCDLLPVFIVDLPFCAVKKQCKKCK